MWNTNLTIPTLIILALLTGTYMFRKHLPLRASQVFEALLIVSLLTIAADLLSTKMDERGNLFSGTALWFANYLFFFMFLFRSFMLFWLPVIMFRPDVTAKIRRSTFLIAVAEQIFLLIGSLTGTIFSIQNGKYVSGPFYQFINLQFMVWIALGFIFLRRVRLLFYNRKAGLYIYFAVLAAGVTIRTAFPFIVVMNFFSTFAILIVYILYMNPDQYMDDAAHIFNERGWRTLLNEIPVQEDFSLVGFGIRNFSAIRETRGVQTLNNAISLIGEWVRTQFPGLTSFYNDNGVFILTSTKFFDQEVVLHQILQRFELPWSATNGNYYLKVNTMRMTPLEERVSSETLANIMWDTYPYLTAPGEAETIQVNTARIHKQARKANVQRTLLDALASDGLSMFLQPVVNTQTDAVEGAEALCRLQSDRGGYIFPDEFIPLAMKNGSMGTLGRQMFRKVCAFMSREDVRFSSLQWVNVNVAPEQFRNPNLLDEFLSDLKEFDLAPSRVHLEITEETMIDRALLHECMVNFRAHGFVFSMDDFGSSYSNMIRLQQNNFSNVKIDRDFTWSYFRNKTSLLPDIISTCHNLGMKVVTEGVETKEMVDGVKAIHADYIQGYYYSKPIPAEEFLEKFVSRGGV